MLYKLCLERSSSSGLFSLLFHFKYPITTEEQRQVRPQEAFDETRQDDITSENTTLSHSVSHFVANHALQPVCRRFFFLSQLMGYV